MAGLGREATSPFLIELAALVRNARTTGTTLRIVGGDTKRGWWRTTAGAPLSLCGHRGIVAYEPSELVITARAGTLLDEIESALAARGQMLGFEPPKTGAASTIGGVVAAALSGPARPYRGAVRDFVLGVNLLTHEGDTLRFGGRVMKNVAGYDVSRLLCGSWGRLGPITEVSLRVVPVPERTLTACWHCDETAAWRRMRDFARTTLPISACRFARRRLTVRLSGAALAIQDAIRAYPPDEIDETGADWEAWRDYTHPYFAGAPIWRVVVPAGTPPLAVDGTCAWDWGGALRWYRDVSEAGRLTQVVAAAGGQVRRWPSSGLEPIPDPATRALATRVRASFDPAGMFNPEPDEAEV